MVGLVRAEIVEQSEVARCVFGIRAAAEAQSLSRVLGLFAQRSIVPVQVCCRRSGDMLVIDIEVEAIEGDSRHHMLARLQEMPIVARANLVERRP